MNAQEKLLRKGVSAWNEWRSAHREESVQLRGANLSGLELGGADLTGADLANADLHKTVLAETILNDAVLEGADLRTAWIAHAACRNTDFRTRVWQTPRSA